MLLLLFDMRETGGFELTSTITLVLQANRLTKCASHPSNVVHSFLGMHGLTLNKHGAGKLALNFVKRIRSILNSRSAK